MTTVDLEAFRAQVAYEIAAEIVTLIDPGMPSDGSQMRRESYVREDAADQIVEKYGLPGRPRPIVDGRYPWDATTDLQDVYRDGAQRFIDDGGWKNPDERRHEAGLQAVASHVARMRASI